MNKEQSKAKPLLLKYLIIKNGLGNEDLNNCYPTIDNLKTNKISDKCISKMIEINDTNNLKKLMN